MRKILKKLSDFIELVNSKLIIFRAKYNIKRKNGKIISCSYRQKYFTTALIKQVIKMTSINPCKLVVDNKRQVNEISRIVFDNYYKIKDNAPEGMVDISFINSLIVSKYELLNYRGRKIDIVIDNSCILSDKEKYMISTNPCIKLCGGITYEAKEKG